MVFRTVKQHNRQIEAQSELGVGTEFTIYNRRKVRRQPRYDLNFILPVSSWANMTRSAAKL